MPVVALRGRFSNPRMDSFLAGRRLRRAFLAAATAAALWSSSLAPARAQDTPAADPAAAQAPATEPPATQAPAPSPPAEAPAADANGTPPAASPATPPPAASAPGTAPAGTPPQAAAKVIDRTEIQGVLGRQVLSRTGEDMGRIVEVIVDRTGGHPRAVIIDFGGFLGVGVRKIAVDWNVLQFASEQGNERVTLDLTRDQVKAAPEYKEGRPLVVLTRPPPAEAAPPPQ